MDAFFSKPGEGGAGSAQAVQGRGGDVHARLTVAAAVASGATATLSEVEYLNSQPLGRIATVGADGRPHVMPVGCSTTPRPRRS
jgi:hypothetical protein